VKWLDHQNPDDLVYIDESGSNIAMTPDRALAPRGERSAESVPRNRGSVTTMIGAISLRGMFALMTVVGATTIEVFLAYVREVLVPELRPGQVVLWDNLAAHKDSAVIAAVRAVGASVRFLPPYSPDFNPIELAWSKIKHAIKKRKARTTEALDDAYAEAAAEVTTSNAHGWFRHCSELAHAA